MGLAKEKINEVELLILAKNGDLEAFEKILYTYEKPIFNYLYRLVRQKQDAEDLTQAAFIKLYKSLKFIDPDKNFKSWLYKIATNTAYDWFRKKKRQAELLVPEAEEYLETNQAEEAYYEVETAFELEQALDQIKPVYKSVLLLYYKEELSYQEIADSLGLPINTVKTYIRRGKQILKIKLTNN